VPVLQTAADLPDRFRRYRSQRTWRATTGGSNCIAMLVPLSNVHLSALGSPTVVSAPRTAHHQSRDRERRPHANEWKPIVMASRASPASRARIQPVRRLRNGMPNAGGHRAARTSTNPCECAAIVLHTDTVPDHNLTTKIFKPQRMALLKAINLWSAARLLRAYTSPADARQERFWGTYYMKFPLPAYFYLLAARLFLVPTLYLLRRAISRSDVGTQPAASRYWAVSHRLPISIMVCCRTGERRSPRLIARNSLGGRHHSRSHQSVDQHYEHGNDISARNRCGSGQRQIGM